MFPFKKLSRTRRLRTPDCTRPQAVDACQIDPRPPVGRVAAFRRVPRFRLQPLLEQGVSGKIIDEAAPDNMNVVDPCAAGLDVHKMSTAASVRVWKGGGEDGNTAARTFPATARNLREMADWLSERAVADLSITYC